MFDFFDDFPPPFKFELVPIGSVGFDPGHSFEFKVGEDGFTVTREFGPISPGDWFHALSFWPEDVFWTRKRKRLDGLINSIPKSQVRDAAEVQWRINNNLSFYYGESLEKFIKEERETSTRELPELWKRYPEMMKLRLTDGPIFCPKAYIPEFCGLEIGFDPKDRVWRLDLLTTYSEPYDDDPDPTELECDSFDELIKRKDEIHLDWKESFIRKQLIAADPRWERFINLKRGDDLRPIRKENPFNAAPIEVDFFKSIDYPQFHNLGITREPLVTHGEFDSDVPPDAFLEANLGRLSKVFKASPLISFLSEDDCKTFDERAMIVACEYYEELDYSTSPIFGKEVPDDDEKFMREVESISGLLKIKDKENIVLHAKSGTDHAHLIAACALIAAGDEKISSEIAIDLVRENFGTDCLQSEKKLNYIKSFETDWIARKRHLEFLEKQQIVAEQNKERIMVLSRSWLGERGVYRFKGIDGLWYFFCRDLDYEDPSWYEDDEDDEDGEEANSKTYRPPFEPYETLASTLDATFPNFHVFEFELQSLREDFVEELTSYVDERIEMMSKEKRRSFSYSEPLTSALWMKDCEILEINGEARN